MALDSWARKCIKEGGVKGVADELQLARYMGQQERRERFEALMTRLRAEDVAHWRDDCRTALAEVAERRNQPAAS